MQTFSKSMIINVKKNNHAFTFPERKNIIIYKVTIVISVTVNGGL